MTPPYLLILLYLAHAAIAFVSLWRSPVDEERDTILVTLALAQLVWTTALAWVAGSLPMRAVLPTENVAQHGAVSSTKSLHVRMLTLRTAAFK